MSPDRCFVFLQGPHGPFYDALGQALSDAGCRCLRVGFNGGDAKYWSERASFIPYHGDLAGWPEFLSDLMRTHGVTDVVLYSDTRPVHRAAIAEARRAGAQVHCFEEGYLRPYWVTYERGGANGNSPVAQMDMLEIAGNVRSPDAEPPEAPAHWGQTRRHAWYGARYHWAVWRGARRFPGFRGHRKETIAQEFLLHLKRLMLLPVHAAQRDLATRRLKRMARPYHVVLCQLAHDANMRDHSDVVSQGAFVEEVVAGFAAGAGAHHQLVFKAHPLEDGREDLPGLVAAAGARHGVADRVWFLSGGKLGPLLDAAASAVTVNSTAAQQAMWRGLPVKAFGRAVYAKPPLVSDQPLEAFFAAPQKPDLAVYRLFRLYLLETSQILGGFYSADGRRRVLRVLVDRMLAPADPYSQQNAGKTATISPNLRVVGGVDLTRERNRG